MLGYDDNLETIK